MIFSGTLFSKNKPLRARKPRKAVRRQLFNLTNPIFVETLLIMLTGATAKF